MGALHKAGIEINLMNHPEAFKANVAKAKAHKPG